MQKIFSKTDHNQQAAGNMRQGAFFDTDTAWRSLNQRLEKDGLLTAPSPVIRAVSYPAWSGWAAAILIFIITGIALFGPRLIVETEKLITVSNGNDDNTLVHTLEDGTIVYLANNTSISFPRHFDQSQRRVTLRGEAFFDIEHQAERPFFVETAQVVIEVLGTSFNLRATNADDSDFELFVEEGLVRARYHADNTKHIEAGMGELIQLTNKQLSKTTTTDAHRAAWKINRMHFKDETLGNVMSVINRNYAANIVFQTPELQKRKITVTFYNNSLPTIIELICLSMNMEAEVISGKHIMLKPNT